MYSNIAFNNAVPERWDVKDASVTAAPDVPNHSTGGENINFPASGVRALLVDDEPSYSLAAERAFAAADENYTLSVARTISAARQMIVDVVPTLVITACELPDGHGTELIRPDEHLRSPVLVMIAPGDTVAGTAVVEAGAFDYVVRSYATMRDLPDVTRRALRSCEQVNARCALTRQLKAVLGAIDGSMLVFSRSGVVLECRGCDGSFFRMTPEDLIGRRLSEVVGLEPWRQLLELSFRASESGEVETGVIELTQSGGAQYASARVVAFGGDHCLAILHDVTLRRRSELLLQQLGDRERSILQHVVDGMSNKQIGHCLGLSNKTIEAHRSRLMKKLGVCTMAGLMTLALSVRSGDGDRICGQA